MTDFLLHSQAGSRDALQGAQRCCLRHRRHIIDVEVDFSGVQVSNEEHFHTVGLPDAAVRESRDRVRAAIKNSGF